MGAWMVSHNVAGKPAESELAFSDWSVAFSAMLEEMVEYADQEDAEEYGQVAENVGLTAERLRILEVYRAGAPDADGQSVNFQLNDGVNLPVMFTLEWDEDTRPVDDNDMADGELESLLEWAGQRAAHS